MNVSELTGAALDWAVCKCEGTQPSRYTKYSTDWAHGGPIVERMLIAISAHLDGDEWVAHDYWNDTEYTQVGPTPLIAAMRCYVASCLGDEVEIPQQLLQGEEA